MLDLLIRNGTLVDGQGQSRGTVGVAGSRLVARYAEGAELPAARRIIDADSLLVMPGIVDPHVHFYGEGMGDYSRLAAMGGVTTYIGMIRGEPEEPLPHLVERHRVDGVANSLVDFSFHVVLYDRADTIAQLAEIAARGFRSYKMFLAYKRRGMMVSEPFLFAAMEEARRHGGIVLVHSEDGELVDRLEQAAIAAGRTAPEDYAPTRPPEAEAAAIDMVGLAAQATGCPAYIVHVSSEEGLAAVERARRRGVPLWAETCPQYILMGDDAMRRHGAPARIAPPLRNTRDRRALGTALATGAINTVGSDHASYSPAAKAKGRDNIFEAPFGMPGAPTHFPSMFTWALENDVALPTLVRAMAETPARLFGLAARKGSLAPGMDADIILVDPAARQAVDAEKIWPGVCPNPLAGASLAGWPKTTISRGEVVWDDGQFTANGGRGELIAQAPGARR
ncbi:amidohydrolase family protein [Bradyrhizobium sp. NP1]|uniref:dihydroorotase n=1 Tax=Bradyrhizobium sp. NP1 TaxID=3049772 RepID=UPI0025A65A36|nr:amidohydrolase family protein [Bradyrhizobium sp. NP1]WJR76661.1 amidohydrolase family protein [Bradyrhizobium sp. NP1]